MNYLLIELISINSSQSAFMSHYKLSVEERYSLGITDNLVRVSVGLEDYIDLIEDFEQALEKAIKLQ